jgi:hypothetical protein
MINQLIKRLARDCEPYPNALSIQPAMDRHLSKNLRQAYFSARPMLAGILIGSAAIL